MAVIGLSNTVVTTFPLVFTNSSGHVVSGPASGEVTVKDAAVSNAVLAGDGQSVIVTAVAGTTGANTITYSSIGQGGAALSASQDVQYTEDMSATSVTFGAPV